MHKIGREIRRLREEREWNQAKLAVAAGIGGSAVSLIETGKRNPSAATLAKLADALGVEVADFFPKAQAPLPMLPDIPVGGAGSREEAITNAIADLQRTTARYVGFQEVQQALDEFCGVWEKRLAEEDFDKAAIEEAGRTIKYFWPAVRAAADSEMVEGMRISTYEEAAANSKLLPAIMRFQALCEGVNSTYHEMFLGASASNVLPFPVRVAS